jgi:hypothetical protein
MPIEKQAHYKPPSESSVKPPPPPPPKKEYVPPLQQTYPTPTPQPVYENPYLEMIRRKKR